MNSEKSYYVSYKSMAGGCLSVATRGHLETIDSSRHGKCSYS